MQLFHLDLIRYTRSMPTAESEHPSVVESVTERLWPLWVFRVTMTVTAALMFDQAVLAGQFMAGVYPALATHRDMATVTGIAVIATIVAAVLVRRRGGGSRWPIVATSALLVLMALQAFAGFRSLLGLHIPLGVTVIMLTAALTVWAWRKR